MGEDGTAPGKWVKGYEEKKNRSQSPQATLALRGWISSLPLTKGHAS